MGERDKVLELEMEMRMEGKISKKLLQEDAHCLSLAQSLLYYLSFTYLALLGRLLPATRDLICLVSVRGLLHQGELILERNRFERVQLVVCTFPYN